MQEALSLSLRILDIDYCENASKCAVMSRQFLRSVLLYQISIEL